MSIDNKEQFNLLTRKILNLLISACPVPVEITGKTFELPKGVMEDLTVTGVFSAGFYNESSEEEFLGHTLKWLQDEGFVRAIDSEHYVATLQTLTLAGAVPNALSA